MAKVFQGNKTTIRKYDLGKNIEQSFNFIAAEFQFYSQLEESICSGEYIGIVQAETDYTKIMREHNVQEITVTRATLKNKIMGNVKNVNFTRPRGSHDQLDRWIPSNRLKLNSDKTQLIWLGSRQQLLKVNPDLILLGASRVRFQSSVVDLGVALDSNLSMRDHVSRLCYWHYCRVFIILVHSVRPRMVISTSHELELGPSVLAPSVLLGLWAVFVE